MSPWRRLVAIFGAKAHAALDRAEDPRETLEIAYAKALAAVQDARRGVVEVLTGEKRLELEAQSLHEVAGRCAQAAAEAARSGDDASARRALGREAAASFQRDRLRDEIAQLREQRLALEALTESMRRRVELLRTEKLALGVRYAAAQATARTGANVTGLSSGMADVAASVERAREKARDAQARAAALLEFEAGDDARLRTPDASVAPALIEARLAALKGRQELSG